MEKVNFFNRHLVQTGENYFEHFLFAFAMAMWILLTGFILIVHAFCPFLFRLTASSSIKKLHEVMHKRRDHLISRINSTSKNVDHLV